MRFLKQIAYSIFYVIVLGAITGLLLGFISAPTTTNDIDETVSSVAPMSIRILGDAEVYKLDSGLTTVFATIFNPNKNYDARFHYVVRVFTPKNEIISESFGTGVVYALSNTYINERAIKIFEDRINVEIDFVDVQWISGSSLAQINVSDASTTLDNNEALITGFVTNNNPSAIAELKIIGVLSSRFGIGIFSSQTTKTNLGAYETSDFTIRVPLDDQLKKDIDLDNTETFMSIIRDY